MAKDLRSGLDGILGGQKNIKEPISKQLTESHRATFVIDKKQHEKLKAIAWWERKQIKEVLKNALELYYTSRSKEELEMILDKYTDFNKNKE